MPLRCTGYCRNSSRNDERKSEREPVDGIERNLNLYKEALRAHREGLFYKIPPIITFLFFIIRYHEKNTASFNLPVVLLFNGRGHLKQKSTTKTKRPRPVIIGICQATWL